MRTIWKGTLRFGRVSINVGLAPALVRGDVEFRTLHAECGTPIRQQLYCPLHERVVEADELVKGWEVAPGQFVVVTPDELTAIAPDAARTIETFAAVQTLELDRSLLAEKAYYLAPSEQPIGRGAYALLVRALRESNAVLLGRFVAWNADHLCAIRARDDVSALVLQTLHLPADLVQPRDIAEALAGTEVVEEEANLARELISRLFTTLGRVELEGRHRSRVRELLEAKLAGSEIARAETIEPEQTTLPTLDLATALKQSLRDTRPRSRPRRTAKTR